MHTTCSHVRAGKPSTTTTSASLTTYRVCLVRWLTAVPRAAVHRHRGTHGVLLCTRIDTVRACMDMLLRRGRCLNAEFTRTRTFPRERPRRVYARIYWCDSTHMSMAMSVHTSIPMAMHTSVHMAMLMSAGTLPHARVDKHAHFQEDLFSELTDRSSERHVRLRPRCACHHNRPTHVPIYRSIHRFMHSSRQMSMHMPICRHGGVPTAWYDGVRWAGTHVCAHVHVHAYPAYLHTCLGECHALYMSVSKQWRFGSGHLDGP